MYLDLAILALFVFFYSVVAGRVERTPISRSIVFLLFGLVLGPVGIVLFDLDAEGLRTLVMVVACTIILSILAHGLTAIPFATAFGKRASRES